MARIGKKNKELDISQSDDIVKKFFHMLFNGALLWIFVLTILCYGIGVIYQVVFYSSFGVNDYILVFRTDPTVLIWPGYLIFAVLCTVSVVHLMVLDSKKCKIISIVALILGISIIIGLPVLTGGANAQKTTFPIITGGLTTTDTGIEKLVIGRTSDGYVVKDYNTQTDKFEDGYSIVIANKDFSFGSYTIKK